MAYKLLERTLLVGMMVLVVGGCTAMIAKDSPDEAKRDAVRERATARWELIIKGRAPEAYEFLSKASRQVIARDDFAARMSRTVFRTVNVEKVECSGELCQARVAITYDHPIMKGVGLANQENWIIENGQVWLVWPQ